MSECTHDCSSCKSKDCAEKKDFREKQNEFSNVKKVIGVVSGKGGVGKSLITSLLAVLTRRKGFNTAILDADITGPSIPKVYGVNEKAEAFNAFFNLTKKVNSDLEMRRTANIWERRAKSQTLSHRTKG